MSAHSNQRKPKAVGINHVALEVGSIDQALEFYGQFLEFEVASRTNEAAFVYFGDQFINFSCPREQGPDRSRHVGIAVDDKPLARQILQQMGVQIVDDRFLDFLDPWGNRVELTTYTEIQFTKSSHVLRGMGLSHLKKSPKAIAELRAKSMAPDDV